MPHPRPLLAALAAACFPLAGATGTAVADAGPTGVQNAIGYYVALGHLLAAGYQPGQGDDKTGGDAAGADGHSRRSAEDPAGQSRLLGRDRRLDGRRWAL